MANNNENEYEYEFDSDVVTLELDDGTSLDCCVIAYFDVDDMSYIALMPIEYPDDYDGEEDDILVYRYIELSEDEFNLEPIEDEDEFDRVSDEFDRILDEMEFN